VPGVHGGCNLDPQYTALTNVLRACLSGEKLPASDPAAVFDRRYRLESRGERTCIVDSAGEMYTVERSMLAGYLDTFSIHDGATHFAGWAVEPCDHQPAQTIAVFLDGEFLGYGASGIASPDAARHLPLAAQYAGFDFRFTCVGSPPALAQPRLFVLSSSGRAAELRISTQEELVTLRAKLDECREELSNLRAQLDLMKHSTCWRITLPLRQVRHMARRIFGR
jgi:ribosomal protein L29